MSRTFLIAAIVIVSVFGLLGLFKSVCNDLIGEHDMVQRIVPALQLVRVAFVVVMIFYFAFNKYIFVLIAFCIYYGLLLVLDFNVLLDWTEFGSELFMEAGPFLYVLFCLSVVLTPARNVTWLLVYALITTLMVLVAYIDLPIFQLEQVIRYLAVVCLVVLFVSELKRLPQKQG